MSSRFTAMSIQPTGLFDFLVVSVHFKVCGLTVITCHGVVGIFPFVITGSDRLSAMIN